MTTYLSRRKLSDHIADQLLSASDASQVINKLAGYLIDSRRTKELELIVRDIEYKLQDRGVVLARVTSASVLTQATKDAVEKLVQNNSGASKVYLNQFIDTDLIGGVRIDLPGHRLDATIARRLATLKANYKK
jgi:F0F1-type ATP synthase delta subunit